MNDFQNITAKAQIKIHKPATDVFDAFATPDTMSKFWFTRHDEGMQVGGTLEWSVGAQPDAPKFEVRIVALERPKRISFAWGDNPNSTTVTLLFESVAENTTLLRVEESGFQGEPQKVIDRALDSTGGFNQVIVAAKALLEHGATINVVADHA